MERTFTLQKFGEGFSYIYRPQRSWGKVMFLHVSVILFIEGGLSLCPGGCPSRAVLGGSLSQEGLCPGGVSVQGVSVQGGFLCPGGSLSREGSLSWRPPYSNERTVRILLECILVYG